MHCIFKCMSAIEEIKSTRVHERRHVGHELRVMFTREMPDGCERTISGRVIDRSAIGLCVETQAFVSKGEILKVCTDISSESEIYFDVRWVRPKESGYIFGCNFTDLSVTS
jgi:hypothetical protein